MRWIHIRCQKNFKKFFKKVRVNWSFATFANIAHNFFRLNRTPDILYLFRTARGHSTTSALKKTWNNTFENWSHPSRFYMGPFWTGLGQNFRILTQKISYMVLWHPLSTNPVSEKFKKISPRSYSQLKFRDICEHWP